MLSNHRLDKIKSWTVTCTLPKGMQHIPLWRLNTSTAKEDHHSLLLSFGVGCWLFWPLPSVRHTMATTSNDNHPITSVIIVIILDTITTPHQQWQWPLPTSVNNMATPPPPLSLSTTTWPTPTLHQWWRSHNQHQWPSHQCWQSSHHDVATTTSNNNDTTTAPPPQCIDINVPAKYFVSFSFFLGSHLHFRSL